MAPTADFICKINRTGIQCFKKGKYVEKQLKKQRIFQRKNGKNGFFLP